MIFLTGGTGFLGREILGRLLVSDHSCRVALLVRPRPQETAESRVETLLAEVFGSREAAQPFTSRVQAVAGEITLPNFGLGDAEFALLASQVTAIFHSAATTTLNEDLLVSREINVGGTEHVLNLARRAQSLGSNPRFYHISTAYVAGSREGVVLPEELNFAPGFRNNYEQTKAEAEALVRDASEHIQTIIFRPSIIVGDSISGQTSAFNVIYVPAKLLVRGFFRFFPAKPNTPFDVVPVDYVADAIQHLSQLHRLPSGTCFHLTVGLGRESTPWEILETLFHTYNTYRRSGPTLVSIPPLVPPELLALAFQSLTVARSSIQALERMVSTKLNVFRQTVPFIPYMLQNPSFDASGTANLLKGSQLGSRLSEDGQAPIFRSYAETVFRYCLETNFGRNPWKNPYNLPTWVERSQKADSSSH